MPETSYNSSEKESAARPSFLRRRDVAARLNLSESHVKMLIARRVIPTVRVGRAVLIPVDKFEAYVRELSDRAVVRDSNALSDTPRRRPRTKDAA